jgi:hypothetical protein
VDGFAAPINAQRFRSNSLATWSFSRDRVPELQGDHEHAAGYIEHG